MNENKLRKKFMEKEGYKKSRLLVKDTERKKFSRKVDVELRAMCGRRTER